jgi:dynein heavy chain
MAAYVGRSKISEIHFLTAGDPDQDDKVWRGHFKRLIRLCGLGLAPNMAILVRDAVLTPGRLQDISCVLNGTDIPGLFTNDEIRNLVAEMEERGLLEKSEIKAPVQDSYAQLVQMAYDSMHLIICVDPYTNGMRDLFADYPSLASRCALDWFEDWPAETMQQMAERHLPSLFSLERHGDLGSKMIKACGGLHHAALATARVSRGCLFWRDVVFNPCLSAQKPHVHVFFGRHISNK